MDEKTEADTKQKEKRIDLSLAQVAGSALAAAVAAYLAGQLGVYGTIIGAGVVSVVATTGGTIFQHLFRRTGEQIKEAAVTTRPRPRRVSTSRSRSTTTRSAATAPPPAGPTMVLPTFDKHGTEDPVTSVAARDTGPDATRTQLIPRHRQEPPGDDPEATRLMARPVERTMALGRAAVPDTDATTVLPGVGTPGNPGPGSGDAGRVPPGTEETTATYGTRLRGWKRPALGALAVFVLAMGAVTATELVTGETPSGQQGTTLGNLTTGNVSPPRTGTPRTPEPGHSPGNGTGHDHGTPTPGPGRSGDSGTGGTDSGPGRGGQTPTPTPSDGATGSPSPGTSSSPDPAPSHSDATGGDGGKPGPTGGATPDHQQNEQLPGNQQTPDPNAP
ncbi:hypothetical protein ADL22_04710 [Streptomyces sp. NRRL F-4489]|uniref:hypothetical protein n=1 Tax=Streptomyces sp. NRRL F-4489 TaxID=1609095 RepID=UPI00074A98A8|nr:hypothetical protein [Streptomyces sp. NRRL F-4489]KUL52816.1 hypothetical protein ADL22_04710 [Streptomyces sp. NRRL F-4489]